MKLFKWYLPKTRPVNYENEYFFAYRTSKDPTEPGWDLIGRGSDGKWYKDWIPMKNFNEYFEEVSYKLSRIQERVLIRRLFWLGHMKWDPTEH
jgi:hypothetical protein